MTKILFDDIQSLPQTPAQAEDAAAQLERDFLAIVREDIGLLIALAGYLTNAHYKRKANKRHAAEHELRMARLRRGMDSDTDLGTLGAEE